jgi:hypothetical protein
MPFELYAIVNQPNTHKFTRVLHGTYGSRSNALKAANNAKGVQLDSNVYYPLHTVLRWEIDET